MAIERLEEIATGFGEHCLLRAWMAFAQSREAGWC